jgi:hypothetical protein
VAGAGAKVTFAGPSENVSGTVPSVGAATSFTAKVTVKPSATPGNYTLTVINPDGGRASLINALTVAAGPTITGTGFTSDATKMPSGCTLTNKTISADGTTITATSKCPAQLGPAPTCPVTVTDGALGNYGRTTDKGLTIT